LITVKSIKNEKLEGYDYESESGISEAEKELRRSYIDMNLVKFPEINPVNLTAISEGNVVKIANYRYPSQTNQRKGIIYFNHGFGFHCEKFGYLGKHLAEAGYDFVGMD
jgi:hypothetical protein